MIHVFFDCGSFGSTIESVLHNYTDHSIPIDSKILDDGSMHSFVKEQHVTSVKLLDDFLHRDTVNSNTITTPTYPFKEFKLPTILEHFSQTPSWSTDSKILVYQPDLRACELNLLFKYHKVCAGKVVKCGLGIIVGENQHNIVNWNKDYTHWEQMKPWELREWLSIFYPGFVQDFIDSQYQITGDDWLTLTNTDILYNTKESLLKIINHCGLTNNKDLTEFVAKWQKAQQYIVDEFNLLDQIVEQTIANQPLEWHPINIIAEAIVQQRLRAKGYEIRCDGLDKFPTDAIMFNTLLEKVPQ